MDYSSFAIPKPPPRKKKRPKQPAIDKEFCWWCGKTGCFIAVHHITYRSQGGKDTPDNLIPLCQGPLSNCCHERAHAGEITADELRVGLKDGVKGGF